MPNDLPSLDPGTVVKITQVVEKHLHDALHLWEGMEGIVTFHNYVFRIDESTKPLEQEGTVEKSDDMFMFEMPGSRLRVGPIARMPDDHKVVAWIVAGKLWNVTNVTMLFTGGLRWYIIRTGEVLRLEQ